MEREQSKAIAIPFVGGKDVMPIAGYFGPYPHDYEHLPDYFTEEIMQLIADAGINLMVYSAANYAEHPELVEKNLEYGEKYGVGTFVTDSRIMEASSAEEVKELIANYADRKAFCGMYVVDEPTATYYCDNDGSRLIAKYEKVSKILQTEMDMIGYINLLPVVMLEDYKEKYEKYVDEFCDVLKPKVVSWDHYPFDKYREGKMEIYFYNMDVIRRAAVKRELPFWAFVQAGSQWNDGWKKFDSELPYFPNNSQFDWNVNTSLAFGAQGIQYFPLIQPIQFTLTTTDEGDYERNGILGGMGNKTQWYGYAQKMNKHIAAIDEVLMNSVHKGVLASGEQAVKDMQFVTCVLEGGFNELQSVEGDALIGCFNYQGKTALYVVNHDFVNAQNITLTLDDVHKVTMIQNAKTSYVNDSTLRLEMTAGDGILIVIE